MTFDLKIVQSRIEIIEENLTKLRQLQQMTFEEFMADFRNLDAALRRLQTSIEAMIDICAHFVGRLRLGAPDSSAELIEKLKEAGLLSEDHAKRYIEMIKFRNVVVHLYADIDERRVYDILQEGNLRDFEFFIQDAWRIANTPPNSKS